MVSLPLVSVALVAYEHNDTLEEAVSSVIHQSYTNLEIIVLDDGSKHASDQIIGKFEDPRVRYVHQSNVGPSLATNRAIKETTGEFVALHSGDDVSISTRLEEQLDRMLTNRLDIAFSGFSVIDEKGEERMQPLDRAMNDNAQLGPADILRLMFQGSNVFCAGSALIRRSLLEKIGYFDPRFVQLQDYDLWIRALKAKARIAVLPKPLYRWRRHENNLSGADNATRTRAERHTILRAFFAGLDDRVLQEGFARDIFFHGPGRARRLVNEALCFLAHPEVEMRDFGVACLYKMIGLPRLSGELRALGVDHRLLRGMNGV